MKKYIFVVLMCFCSGMYANLKVATVDVDLALKNSPQVQKMSQDLKKKYTPKQNKIVAARDNLKKAIDALRRDESVMKPDAITKKKQQIEAMAKALQQQESAYQQDLFADRSKRLEELQQDFQKAVSHVAKKQSIDMVVNKPSVIYGHNMRDISSDVAAALKKSA
jgi:Skp family chaperone for outer membrane proteins